MASICQRNLQAGRDDHQAFIGALVHDMGAPLRAVAMFSQLMMQSSDGNLSGEQQEWLQFINEGGVQAQQMLDALARYSRLCDRVVNEETFTLESIVRSVLDDADFARAYDAGYIQIQAMPKEIRGSRNQWTLLFRYLIDNALCYQPEDGAIPPLIKISTHQRSNHLDVIVEDNGIGVEPKYYSSIVLPFKQLNPSSQSRHLGMGLTYCAKIVGLYDGVLSFERSELGGLKVRCSFAQR